VSTERLRNSVVRKAGTLAICELVLPGTQGRPLDGIYSIEVSPGRKVFHMHQRQDPVRCPTIPNWLHMTPTQTLACTRDARLSEAWTLVSTAPCQPMTLLA
jgi:hypothetical protein